MDRRLFLGTAAAALTAPSIVEAATPVPEGTATQHALQVEAPEGFGTTCLELKGLTGDEKSQLLTDLHRDKDGVLRGPWAERGNANTLVHRLMFLQCEVQRKHNCVWLEILIPQNFVFWDDPKTAVVVASVPLAGICRELRQQGWEFIAMNVRGGVESSIDGVTIVVPETRRAMLCNLDPNAPLPVHIVVP